MGDVRDNAAAHRFELERDGRVATLDYDRGPGRITLIHTEVPPELRGHGVGDTLVRGALEIVRREGLTLSVICPFVRAYLRRHPEVPL